MLAWFVLLVTLSSFSFPTLSSARNPFRRAFFDRYPEAENTTLDDVPSNSGHCGVCHFDFDGSGARNPYGLSIEVRLAGGMTDDRGGGRRRERGCGQRRLFSTLVEITDTTTGPTPRPFPG